MACGAWAAGTNDWTEVNGMVNADYAQDSFAIFQGTGGIVTVDNTGGNVLTSGMQFTADGYTIAGGPLTLTGTDALVRVGDGSPADAGLTATISAPRSPARRSWSRPMAAPWCCSAPTATRAAPRSTAVRSASPPTPIWAMLQGAQLQRRHAQHHRDVQLGPHGRPRGRGHLPDRRCDDTDAERPDLGNWRVDQGWRGLARPGRAPTPTLAAPRSARASSSLATAEPPAPSRAMSPTTACSRSTARTA